MKVLLLLVETLLSLVYRYPSMQVSVQSMFYKCVGLFVHVLLFEFAVFVNNKCSVYLAYTDVVHSNLHWRQNHKHILQLCYVPQYQPSVIIFADKHPYDLSLVHPKVERIYSEGGLLSLWNPSKNYWFEICSSLVDHPAELGPCRTEWQFPDNPNRCRHGVMCSVLSV